MVSPELLDSYKRNGWNVKGLDVALSGFFHTVYLHQEPDANQITRTKEVIASLGMEDAMEKDFLSLSLGQAKRMLIARAIVHEPSLLFLDELTTGLDRESTKTVLGTVQNLVEDGAKILYAAHSKEDLPSGITDILQLEAGKIVETSTNEDFPVPAEKRQIKPFTSRPRAFPVASNGHPLIAIRNADVFRTPKRVLRKIDWEIEPGENWAVLGRNGSGKTTLLRLISGDLAPAWGGSVGRFGKETSQSLWEIRGKISLVSADLQAWHGCRQTGLDTVISGFFGSIGVHDPVQEHQTEAARRWLQEYDLEELADRDIQTLSYGQLRILLILRAMVTGPLMLLLDEPLSGLDREVGSRVLNLLDSLAANGTALVYVTHRIDELPQSITRALVLKDGTVDFRGDVEELRIAEQQQIECQ
jgi:molybdate transport system ATP-binding protein